MATSEVLILFTLWRVKVRRIFFFELDEAKRAHSAVVARHNEKVAAMEETVSDLHQTVKREEKNNSREEKQKKHTTASRYSLLRFFASSWLLLFLRTDCCLPFLVTVGAAARTESVCRRKGSQRSSRRISSCRGRR